MQQEQIRQESKIKSVLQINKKSTGISTDRIKHGDVAETKSND